MSDAKVIELDGSSWKNELDFLAALRAAIGAPDWHGWGPDAFIDSMIWGGINTLEPPYTIMVRGLQQAPAAVSSYVDLLSGYLVDADDEHQESKGKRANARMARHPF